MKKFNFNSNRQYREVLNNLAYYPSGREEPTQFNDDRSGIYLASLDYDVEAENIKHLEMAIDDILSKYKSRLSEERTAHSDLRLAILRCDFNEVAFLLHNIRTTSGDVGFRDNTNYIYPDELFDELISKQV
ncbi:MULTISPECIES: hypothetical protein [Acinetobacter calcoaceticus/baumannii complex]|uniref:hypothetical protein n=1 Tax=Acinetobacter calcoaceticus/baumannii complex TaxID=909768 RepID=UPI002812AFFC|nr:hypothetical protein [Acinetobacter pittii]MDQ9890084.1 hypothetical protein [Acinetobacter pittii]